MIPRASGRQAEFVSLAWIACVAARGEVTDAEWYGGVRLLRLERR